MMAMIPATATDADALNPKGAAMRRCLAGILVFGCLLLLESPAVAKDKAGSRLPHDWLARAQALAQAASVGNAGGQGSAEPFLFSEQAKSLPAADEPSADATPTTAPQKSWEVKFKVYSWLTAINGRAGRGSNVSSLDVDYCDVIDNLDLIECMVPVNLEARVGRWGAYVDLFYIRLEDRAQGPLGLATADLEGKQTILEIAGFYRVGTWPCMPARTSSLTLDILAGARYNRLEGNIGLQLPRNRISVGGTREWWDPFIGPRLTWQVTEKLGLFGRVDVGGFGLDNSSHFAWQYIAGAQYDITRNCFIELGYRMLDTDFEEGSGSDKFTYDVRTSGPYLALGVKF